jgi:hypothetical protein
MVSMSTTPTILSKTQWISSKPNAFILPTTPIAAFLIPEVQTLHTQLVDTITNILVPTLLLLTTVGPGFEFLKK